MSRRWIRRSSPSVSSNLSDETLTDNALTTTLVGDLSRRLFGKGLLVAVPVAAAALLAEAPAAAAASNVGDWALNGNAIPDTSKFLGTTTAQPLIIKTNNSEQVRVLANGNVGVGLTSPKARLHVKDAGTGIGVMGESNLTGVHGYASGSAVTGVIGEAIGVAGPWAIWGISNSTDGSATMAGVFHGNVAISGTLMKSSGTFKIDHPLDPANKYLSHSFVESPDMMNVYNGNVTLGADGTAAVELPAYFEALNRDFRYQLTAIGAPGPNLYIAAKIKDNRFTIAGGTPGMEVSWQVTGIRQDAWANAHRVQVEEDKPAQERGTYLTPKEHGQPENKGRDYERLQRLRAQAPK